MCNATKPRKSGKPCQYGDVSCEGEACLDCTIGKEYTLTVEMCMHFDAWFRARRGGISVCSGMYSCLNRIYQSCALDCAMCKREADEATANYNASRRR